MPKKSTLDYGPSADAETDRLRSRDPHSSRALIASIKRNVSASVLKAISEEYPYALETIFTSAVAATIALYSRDEAICLLAATDEESQTAGIIELSLTPSSAMTIRSCVTEIAKQLSAEHSVAYAQDVGWESNSIGHSPDVFRPDIHRWLITSQSRRERAETSTALSKRALADGRACLVIGLHKGRRRTKLAIAHRTDLVTRHLIKKLARHVLRVLRIMAHAPDRLLAECEVTGQAEQTKLVGWARGPRRSYSLKCNLKELFERCAAERAAAPALIDQDDVAGVRSIKYGELNSFANKVAHQLEKAGCTRGSAVAVVMRRSIESVCALLSTIKAGGVYVPIGDSYPDDYIRRILRETTPVAVITGADEFQRLSALAPDATVIPIKWAHNEPESRPNLRTTTGADDILLVMYTSGSTGNAKGVVHRQRQVLNRLHWMWETYPFTRHEVVCHRSPPTVMPSMWELLGGLLRGVPTAIASLEVTRDPARTAGFIARHRVTRMTILPSVLRRLLESKDQQRALTSLKVVTFGGEMFTPDLYSLIRRSLPKCVFIEDYGCTETNTIWHYALHPEDGDVDTSPGGQPIANLGAYVLNRFSRICPEGVIGELTVAGDSLAIAYLGAPEKYREKFVDNRVDPTMGPVLCRTGDLAYYTRAGSIKLVGRADHQLKIRGMRVEPSEVETSLSRIDSVAECCVISPDATKEGSQLVAFLVPRQGTSIGPTEIRVQLSAQLPSFMVPNRIIVTDALPKTLSGKLDRRALLAQIGRDTATADVIADLKMQQTIVAELAQILEQPPSEIDDNTEFALLGLDSLSVSTLATRLSSRLGMGISATSLFDHCTVASLSHHLIRERTAQVAPVLKDTGRGGAVREAAPGSSTARQRQSDIAVIGMAARFPDAETLDQFWENLSIGKDSVTEIPPDRWPVPRYYDPDPGKADKSISKWGAFLGTVRNFDPLFFGIAPAEAALLDPQHRIGLEEAWKAFEDAGYAQRSLDGRSVGVFIGLRKGELERLLDRQALAPNRATLLGNDPSMLAARIAYRLNLTGPSLTIDTACSSSLAAVHLACQSLIMGECDIALAGGASVILSPEHYIATSKLGIFSPTGKCRAFDENADGFVEGEGAGFVVLRRLEEATRDRDNIQAIVKATGLNQDGRTNGIGAPSRRSQTRLQQRVYGQFNIDPRTITYIEAHGTGTQLGDQIEIEALTESFKAFGVVERNSCGVGSVKTNIGHLTAAAGIAGLIKTVLALKHRRIPPSLNYAQSSASAELDETPFFINDAPRLWDAMAGSPRRAAINSFGLSGTNVHCVIEEAPEISENAPDESPAHLIVLSARTQWSLSRLCVDLRNWIRERAHEVSLSDVAYTLLVGRERHRYVLALVVSGFAELERTLMEEASASGGRSASPPLGDSVEGNAAVASVESILGKLESGRLTRDDFRGQLFTLGSLVVRGLHFRPDRLYPQGKARRISLPTYPFERQVCWPAPGSLRPESRLDRPEDDHNSPPPPTDGAPFVSSDLRNLLRETLERVLDLAPATTDPTAGLDTYGYDSIVAVDLRAQLVSALGHDIPISVFADAPSLNDLVERLGNHAVVVAPSVTTTGIAVSDKTTSAHSTSFPLTDLQTSYLFNSEVTPDEPGSRTYLEFSMAGLNATELSRAWNRLIRHHAMLRATITHAGEQRILDMTSDYSIKTYELKYNESVLNHLSMVRKEMLNKPYPRESWPLFDVRVTQPQDTPAVVHVCMDSMIADWQSAERLYQLWYELYHAPNMSLEPLEFTFQEYWMRLRAFRESEAGQRQLAYWRRKLPDVPDGPQIGITVLPDVSPSYQRYSAILEDDAWNAIRRYAEAIRVFPTSIVLACFWQTLSAATVQKRFSLIVTHASRHPFHPQVHSVLGPFTSASVVIEDNAGDKDFEALVTSLNTQTSDNLSNRDVCAAGVLGLLAKETGRIPTLPVVFTSRLRAGGNKVGRAPSWLDNVTYMGSRTPGVVLECRAQDVNDRLEITWDVADARLEGSAAEQMFVDFRHRLVRVSRCKDEVVGFASATSLSAMQRVCIAERVRSDKGPWAEGTIYQEFDVTGLSVTSFRRAMRSLIQLEPALGCTITPDGVLKRIALDQAAVVDVEDLALVGAKLHDRINQVRVRMMSASEKAISSACIRARLSLIPNELTRVHIATDMAVADGHGVLLLYRRLFALCGIPERGCPGAGPTTAHIEKTDREWPPAHDIAIDRAYWRQRVQQAPGGPALPGPLSNSDGGLPVARIQDELPSWRAIFERGKKHQVCPNAVFAAALNCVLAAWAKEDKPFTTVVAITKGDLVGPKRACGLGEFTSLSWVSEDMRLRPFTDRVRDVERIFSTDLEHHQSSPIEALQDLNAANGTASRVALTACLTTSALDGFVGVNWGFGVSLTPGIDLECYVYSQADRLNIHLDYRRAALSEEAAMGMLGDYRQLLECLGESDGAWASIYPVSAHRAKELAALVV